MLHRAFAGKFSTVVCVIAILSFGLLGTVPAYAQVTGATLSGTATDSSGAAIPKAQLSITDLSTGVARGLETDSAGFYSAPNLLPATYEVKVTAPGFSTWLQKGL